MKLWHIVGGVLIGIMFLYQGNKMADSRATMMQRQEQQEDPRIMKETLERLSYKVIYHSPSSQEDSLADIRWLKKAADLALQKGHPYFNIMEQRLIKTAGRVSVDGVIQLSPDPTGAEYDAREIKNLVLSNN